MKKPSGHASPATVVAVVTTFNFIAFVCVVLRLWTRIGIVRQAGWDDMVVSLAMFFTTVFAMCIMNQVHYGLGRHEASLSKSEQHHLLVWFWISIWNYYLGLGLAKLSIVLQYLRIFGHIPKFRKCAYALGFIIFIFTWWTVFVSIFLCQPVSHFWEPHKPGKCLTKLPLWFFNSSFNIATDIATAILPLPVVKSLNLPKRQRHALMAVFGLGGIICVISIVRFHSLYAIAVSDDPSWDNPLAALWAALEATVGIIASCLPTLKGLVTKYFPSLIATASGSRGGGDNTPAIELSRTGKSETTLTTERSRSETWDPKLGGRSKMWGRSGKVRIKEVETDISSLISPDEHDFAEKRGDGITVTTVVEQVERDKREWDCESREQLVPVHVNGRI
ncbi:hypothetical protein Slin14017_G084040 [Septoria linicola]|nr:hypothetical protein Slin14017_G084040 [Septoria linicola]